MSQFPCRKSFCRREKAGWAGYHPVHTKGFLSRKFSQKPCISGYHVKITIIFRDNPYAQTDWSFKNRSACDENISTFSSLQSHSFSVIERDAIVVLLCPYQLFAVSAFRSVGKHIFTSIPQKMFLIDSESKTKRNNTHRSCGSDKSKDLRLFQFVFLPPFIFGCFVCIGECTTIGIAPNGFTPVVVHISTVCTTGYPLKIQKLNLRLKYPQSAFIFAN